MELWDVYDADRVKTGKVMVRGAEFEDGAHHIVIHICLFAPDGRMLIQQRQKDKIGWPGMWDITVGGSALAGENASAAAERELFEELGIRMDLSRVRPHMTVHFAQGFDDVFLVEKDVDIRDLVLQPEEVQDAKWATREEIKRMMAEGTFIPYFPSLIDFFFDSRTHYGMNTL